MHILNTVPSKAVMKTPYELWYDTKPSINHLRVFGCICYVLKPEVNRKKLDEKAEMGVFIGYSSKSKAYKVYVVNADKVIIARNVKMIENAAWNWESTTETLPKQIQFYEQEKDEDSDDQPVRGTRSLAEIYSRSMWLMLNLLELKKP